MDDVLNGIDRTTHTWWDPLPGSSCRLPSSEELDIHIQDAIERKDRMRRVVVKRALRQMLGRKHEHVCVEPQVPYVYCFHRPKTKPTKENVVSCNAPKRVDIRVDLIQYIVPLHRLHIFAGLCSCGKTYYRTKEMGFWET